MSSDRDIMARVQAGDPESFGQLVLRYHDRLLKVAISKLGDRATAEDLVQEAFLAAFGARDTYNQQFAFSTWLWTILLNLCRQHHLRRRTTPQRTALPLGSADNCAAREESALDVLLRTEQQHELHTQLDRLPEPQADALRLRFFGELSYEEIATTMGCSLSGAKRRVKTGLTTLSQLASVPSHISPHRASSESFR